MGADDFLKRLIGILFERQRDRERGTHTVLLQSLMIKVKPAVRTASGSLRGWQGPKYLDHLLLSCIPRHNIEELDQK